MPRTWTARPASGPASSTATTDVARKEVEHAQPVDPEWFDWAVPFRRLTVSRGKEMGGSAFGDLLRDCRLSVGWTQDELADRSGVSTHSISVLEAGRRKPRLSSVSVMSVGNPFASTVTDTSGDVSVAVSVAIRSVTSLTRASRSCPVCSQSATIDSIAANSAFGSAIAPPNPNARNRKLPDKFLEGHGQVQRLDVPRPSREPSQGPTGPYALAVGDGRAEHLVVLGPDGVLRLAL
ncbi:helix-turn-helix domain-containing protein, partial [Kibdelosporangium lantanae]